MEFRLVLFRSDGWGDRVVGAVGRVDRLRPVMGRGRALTISGRPERLLGSCRSDGSSFDEWLRTSTDLLDGREEQLMTGAGRKRLDGEACGDGPRPRFARDGWSILPAEQDRSRWDRTQIRRGVTTLARADACGRGRGAP